MAYEKKSIRAIIDDVNSRRVYLPAIQRKYVWGDAQITRLMDSIMLGYPIGTFLFWKVKKTIAVSYTHLRNSPTLKEEILHEMPGQIRPDPLLPY